MKIIIRNYTKKTIQDLTGDGYILLRNAFFVNLEMPSFPDLLLLMQLRDHTKKTIEDLTKNGYCLLDFSKLEMLFCQDSLNSKKEEEENQVPRQWVDRSRIHFV